MNFISDPHPFRSLTKANNSYMRSLDDTAAEIGYGSGTVLVFALLQQVLCFPKSFTVHSFSASNDQLISI